MIHDFDDFCLWMYVAVDDIWQDLAYLFGRPGPQPECSDSELITMALVGECRGWDIETEMLCQWREHRALFPTVPTQSRFNSADKAAELWEHQRIRLRALPRRTQKAQVAPACRRLYHAVRQIIETVNDQLAEQFHVEINHAHTFWGLCTRLYTKLTAHTLCIYLNRLLGNADFLHIKALAFPA